MSEMFYIEMLDHDGNHTETIGPYTDYNRAYNDGRRLMRSWPGGFGSFRIRTQRVADSVSELLSTP